MTPFSYEHTFQAPSVDALLRAFTDPTHVAAQDATNEVASRTVVERIDDEKRYRQECRIATKRELPAFVRKLAGGGLAYTEIVAWTKGTDAITIDIRPDVMGGRSRIEVTCRIVPVADGQVKRIYAGTASVDVALIGGRIEKSIVTEIGKTLDKAAVTTQRWLDERRSP